MKEVVIHGSPPVKSCSKCLRELPVGEFYKSSTTKCGLSCWCKSCDRIKLRRQVADPSFKAKQSVRWKRYYYRHIDRMRDRYRKFYHSEYGNNQRKEYDKMRSLMPDVVARHRETSKALRSTRAFKDKRNAMLKARRQNDIRYKVGEYVRTRCWNGIHRKKCARTIELLGCSIEFLMQYLEDRFKDGMSWDNYGLRGWHIDHIRPVASFDMTKPEDQRACFHYTNLQPLWWRDNLSKNDKWVPPQ